MRTTLHSNVCNYLKEYVSGRSQKVKVDRPAKRLECLTTQETESMNRDYRELGRGKPSYLKPSICSRCGGICCTKMPGVCLPSDFKRPLLRSLAEAFRSGKYAIDCWEGDPRKNGGGLRKTYFVRPATRNSKGLFDLSWGGECVLLTPSGCSLAPRDRPSGCRMLEPKTNGECYSHLGGMTDNDKRIAAVRWMKYQNITLEAVQAASR